MPGPDRTKIRFRLVDQEVESEGLWAEHVERDQFRLDNVPFFAFGVALDDVIVAKWSDEYDAPEFDRVVARSGHSAYRILVRPEADLAKAAEEWARLEGLGCGRETAGTGRLWAVHAPKGIDQVALNQVLDAGLASELWWVEDGYIHREGGSEGAD